MKTKAKPKSTTPAPKHPCNIPVAAQETEAFQKKVVLHVAGGAINILILPNPKEKRIRDHTPFARQPS